MIIRTWDKAWSIISSLILSLCFLKSLRDLLMDDI